MTEPSLTTRRVAVGIALAACLLCLANYWLGFGVFGRFDKMFLVISFGVLGAALIFARPSVRELEEYRDNKRNSSSSGVGGRER
ncbi:MAG TPA: hypothetical protein VH814_15200 [Steroidobacteraceae bacterium]|jgi:hypothetical protein